MIKLSKVIEMWETLHRQDPQLSFEVLLDTCERVFGEIEPDCENPEGLYVIQEERHSGHQMEAVPEASRSVRKDA
jgi:hypothetical protein